MRRRRSRRRSRRKTRRTLTRRVKKNVTKRSFVGKRDNYIANVLESLIQTRRPNLPKDSYGDSYDFKELMRDVREDVEFFDRRPMYNHPNRRYDPYYEAVVHFYHTEMRRPGEPYEFYLLPWYRRNEIRREFDEEERLREILFRGD